MNNIHFQTIELIFNINSVILIIIVSVKSVFLNVRINNLNMAKFKMELNKKFLKNRDDFK